MRNLFKKPEWASKTTETQPEFYRRSGQTYNDIVAANRAAHQKQKSSPEAPVATTPKESRSAKRLRTSEEPREDEDPAQLDEQSEHEEEEQEHHTSPTPQEQHIQSKQFIASKEGSPQKPRKTSLQHHSSPREDIRSDEPEAPKSPNHALPVHNDNHQKVKESPKLTSNTHHQPYMARRSSPPANDPTVQILITSEIPNCKPLIVQRKMSQGLREVRMEWCRRQEIPDELQSSLYLTWRGRRLFDVTTCKSLGVKVEKSNIMSGIDDDDLESAEQAEIRVHMVAMTENEDLLRRPAMSPSSSNPGSTPLPPPSPEDQQNQPMRLVLKSPNFDDFKIKARSKTPVSKLISAFREKHNIAADQDLWIVFDGDRLDPETCLRDYDVSDKDMLEVQVRPRA